MGSGAPDLTIRVPAGALVMLIGPSGSGKSTFAARHFDASAVISSDRLRGLLAGDEAEQRVTDAAFKRLDRWLDARLEAGGMAVVDATNVDWMRRGALIGRARRHGRPTVAIALDLPLDLCLARSAARQRRVRAGIIRRQHDELRQSLERLDLEGFAVVHVLRSDAEVARVTVQIEKGPAARALSPDD
jgi:protein phosphatase